MVLSARGAGFSRRLARVSGLLLAGLAATATLAAQDDPPPPSQDDEDIKKIGAVDPYTGGDAKAMAAAGIVAFAPFRWADGKSTEDVDRVLGEKRILWMETAHFRLGCNLKSQRLPDKQDERRALYDEIKALRKKLPKVPEKPKKLDPWLRLHLHAQRAEACYAEFQKVVGLTDEDAEANPKGKYLGMPEKFLLLLFQKKSDLARYMDRFTEMKTDQTARYYHHKSGQFLAAICGEDHEGFDDGALHRYVVYSIVHNFVNGYQGVGYSVPLWFDEGLAHYFARKVETEFITANIKDDEPIEQEKQHLWAQKVRRRVQHEGAWFPFEKMMAWRKWEDMGFHAHAQSWSRVDYLMSLGPDKVGTFLKRWKAFPFDPVAGPTDKQIETLHTKLILETWEMEFAEFDKRWREWVLKTYPKK